MGDIRINKTDRIQHKQLEENPKKEEKAAEQVEKKNPDVARKSADDVLSFMAESAVINKVNLQKSKKVDVSKHVDDESADRIAKMMKAFDETILKDAEIAIQEFGLPEDVAQDVAILGFNQKYLQ